MNKMITVLVVVIIAVSYVMMYTPILDNVFKESDKVLENNNKRIDAEKSSWEDYEKHK